MPLTERGEWRHNDNEMTPWRGFARYVAALFVSLLGFLALNVCYGVVFPTCIDCHAHVGVPFAYRIVRLSYQALIVVVGPKAVERVHGQHQRRNYDEEAFDQRFSHS